MTRKENSLKGIVVSVSDYKEKDKTVRAVTERGVRTLILKGVKSEKAKLKFAASLFSTIEYYVAGEGIPVVSGANPLSMRYQLSDDVKKFAAASIVSEAVYKCLDEDGDSAPEFALLELSLSEIEEGKEAPLAVLVWALLKLLTVEGVDFEDYTLGRNVKSVFRAMRDAGFGDIGSLDFTVADFVATAYSAERLLNHSLGIKLKSLSPSLALLGD